MAEHHLWARLVHDPRDFDAIARIMTKVMKYGVEEPYVKNIHRKYQDPRTRMRYLKIGNETVQVNFRVEDGEIRIGNAWVRP